MALIATLNTVGISDPDGWQVALRVSYADDQLNDPKTGVPPLIVASKVFFLDPTATKPDIYDAVLSYGKQVKKARATAAAFAAQYPPGTQITIN